MPDPSPLSVFAEHHNKIYKHQFEVQLTIGQLVGGIPSDPDVAKSWLEAKLGDKATEEMLQEEVAAVLKARGVPDPLAASEEDRKAAAEEVNRLRHLTGFKRDFGTELARVLQEKAIGEGMPEALARRTVGELYIEGRQVKAMIREAANIAVGAGNLAARGWGKTRKGLLSFVAEHIFVPDNQIFLAVAESTRVNQSFVHTWRGSGIKNEEVVEEAVVEFRVISDWPFEDDEWAAIWVTGENNGLGASRSQGFGTFTVTKWKRITNLDGTWKKGFGPASGGNGKTDD